MPRSEGQGKIARIRITPLARIPGTGPYIEPCIRKSYHFNNRLLCSAIKPSRPVANANAMRPSASMTA
ncbi:G1/S-specific cyclin CCN1 [Fusarium oxysporum f. sp. albedinis]|nr:G1/S-specific cyclin CCN1 [Fusarium oxysporum f. sp. albedinis]